MPSRNLVQSGETLRAAWSGVDRLVIFEPNGANPLWSARFRMQARSAHV